MIITSRYNKLLMTYKVRNFKNSMNSSLNLFCKILEIKMDN